VTVRGGHCVSPLPAALVRGHFKTAQLLYERGGDIHVGYGRRTLLHASSITGQIEIVQWLLSHDADPNFRENEEGNGWSPLHLAAHNGRLEVIRMLLQHNADINMRSKDCQTPLHRASEHWYPDVARLLLEHGAEINARDKDGSTPLHMVLQNKGRSRGSRPATDEGMFEVARLLIEHGADVRAEDSDGKTPFQVALDRDMVELLSDLGTK
jgi:ankyrin repeat protein